MPEQRRTLDNLYPRLGQPTDGPGSAGSAQKDGEPQHSASRECQCGQPDGPLQPLSQQQKLVQAKAAEHHVAAAERVAANQAEAEAQKGVRGTARRVRKALTGKNAPSKKGKKK